MNIYDFIVESKLLPSKELKLKKKSLLSPKCLRPAPFFLNL